MSVEDEKIRRRDELLERIAALSGAASVLLIFIGSGFIDHGGKGLDPTQSAEAVGAGFARLTDEARTGAALVGAATFLGLVFLGPLWTRLQRGATWLAVVGVAGGIATAGLQLVFVMMSLAAMTAGEVGDGQTARTLLALEWETSRAGAAPGLALVSAATLAGIRYEVFPGWFSALSLLFTAILVIALFPIGPAGLMGSMGLVWIFIASLVMAFGGRPT